LELGSFLRWEIFAQKCMERPSHVGNEFAFEFKSQDVALSFNENGNSLK